MKLHAVKSPSSSFRWTLCHASVKRTIAANKARESNAAADRGTIQHDLAEHCLRDSDDTFLEQHVGTRAIVTNRGEVNYAPADSSFYQDGHIVSDDMADAVHRYVDYIRQLALGGDLYVEERLSIEHITSEPDAKGTSDTVIDYGDSGCIADAKFGFDRVMASYEFVGDLFAFGPKAMHGRDVRFPNPQLVMYADAARLKYGAKWKKLTIIIVQPHLNHIDEYTMPVEDFAIWVQWIREQADACEGPNPRVLPGEKQCQWCPAFPCAEANELALQTAIDDFEDKPREVVVHKFNLGKMKRLVPYVRMWADAVESRVYAELSQGRPIEGFKLIDGDMGDRAWKDIDKVRATLASFGLPTTDYIVEKVISPVVTEKMVLRKRRTPNKKLTQDQWTQLQELITREPGAPKVVPDTDPRPAKVIDPLADFDDNTEFFQ